MARSFRFAKSSAFPAAQCPFHANMVFMGFTPAAGTTAITYMSIAADKSGSRSSTIVLKNLFIFARLRGTPWPSEPMNSSIAVACGVNLPSGASPLW
jgi:hypothetical protein